MRQDSLHTLFEEVMILNHKPSYARGVAGAAERIIKTRQSISHAGVVSSWPHTVRAGV